MTTQNSTVPSSFLANLSFAFLHLLAPLTLFLCFHTGSMVWQIRYDLALRKSLLAQEIGVGILYCLVITLLSSLPNFRNPERSLTPRLLRILTFASAVVLCTSTIAFLREGQFNGWESFRMFWTMPGQLLAHLQQMAASTLAALTGCILFLGLLNIGLVRICRRLPLRGHAILGILLLLALGWSSIYAPWRPQLGIQDRRPWFDEQTGAVQVVEDVLEDLYQRKTGPFTTLYCSIARMFADDPSLQIDPSLTIQYPDRTSGQIWQSEQKPRPLNLIVLLVESLRADELRATGSERDVMPNLDALARRSQVFHQHLAASSHSNYADLVPLNSHHPFRGRQTHVYPADPAYPRLALHDVLHPFGYRTGIVSSQDENWGQMIRYLDSPGLDTLFHAPDFDGDRYIEAGDVGFAAQAKSKGKNAGKIDDSFTVQEAIRWIGTGNPTNFCLYLNLQNSHFPYRVPEGADRPYSQGLTRPDVPFSIWPLEAVPTMRAFYRDSLHYTDQQIGALIRHLETTGQLQNTIIAITGDTGQAFMEHGFATHANRLFQEVVHTPLILYVPGLAPADHRKRSSHVDIAPTMLAALGCQPHPGHQGVDLLSDSLPETRSHFMVAQSPLAFELAIVHGDYKLRRSLTEPARLTLFNLATDPGERHELSSAHPGITTALRQRLDTWCHAQWQYYRDSRLQRRAYPPQLQDPPLFQP